MLDYDIVVSNRLRAGRPAGALERGRQDEAFFISAFAAFGVRTILLREKSPSWAQ